MGRRRYPPEFRRKVLDLVEAGRPIAEVAEALVHKGPTTSIPTLAFRPGGGAASWVAV